MIKHSIIILTYGRPISIRNAIESIIKLEIQEYDTELIIVDNNSEKELSSDLSEYCQQWSNRLSYVYEPSPGLSAARHRGAIEAKGEILSFLDDDVEVSSTWLSAIQDAFKNNDVVLVGGPSIPKFTSSIPAWFWAFNTTTSYGGWSNSWLSLLDIGSDVDNIDPNYIWGLNFSIRKKVLLDCGGFHPDIVPNKYQRWQGDGETGLTRKLKALNLRAVYRQDALLTHLCGPDRLTVDYFKRRAFYSGVCDSYTKIRDGKPFKRIDIFLKIFKSSIRRVAFRIRGPYFMEKLVLDVIAQTDKAYVAGIKFHINEVLSDPKLIKWIRLENYQGVDIQDFTEEP